MDIKPLRTTRKVLTWYCICTKESRKRHIIFSVVCLLANMSAVVASVTFFLKFVAVNLELSLYALFQISAYSNVVYIYTIAIILRNKVPAIFDGLATIYHQCKTIALFSVIFSPTSKSYRNVKEMYNMRSKWNSTKKHAT